MNVSKNDKFNIYYVIQNAIFLKQEISSFSIEILNITKILTCIIETVIYARHVFCVIKILLNIQPCVIINV